MYREIRDYNVVLAPCNPFYIGRSKCLLFPNYTEMVGKAKCDGSTLRQGVRSPCRNAARSRGMKNDVQSRAREAVEIIRRGSLTIMATWNGNLYKRCLEGVVEFERLRPLVKPATKTVRYSSLMVSKSPDLSLLHR
jgi:hypothetical protein